MTKGELGRIAVETIAKFLLGAAISVAMIPVAIGLTVVILLVLSLPLRLFRKTREPSVAVGIPAFMLASWSLWYGSISFFQALLQYGIASAIAGAIWEHRDRRKGEREATGRQSTGANRRLPIIGGKPPEVVQCLEALEAERTLLSAKSFIIPNEVIEAVRTQLLDVERTVHTVRNEAVAPRNVVLLLLSNISGEFLGSGRYHVYRETLSMVGHELLNVFNYAVDEMEKAGFHDAKAAQGDRQWIREQVRKAG